MPSPADGGARDRLRVWLERAAHALGIAIIAWLLVDSLRDRPPAAPRVVALDALPAQLRRWSTATTPAQVHVRVDRALAPAHREWLAALAGQGTLVSWEGKGVLPVAAALDPVADPDGGTRVAAAAPAGTTVVLEDDLGVVDSVATGATGARFLTQSPLATARVRAGALVAQSVVRDSLDFGRILLLGGVSWESGMVAAALEERGWEVDAHLALSHKGDVTQGPGTAPDTGRYSAVIVLDTAARVDASRLARYVRDGGGVIVTTRASAVPALAPLRAGGAGRAVAAVEPFDTTAREPRRALALTPIVLGADAVPVERRDELVAVAARRLERGRVAAVGYDDTWRWRMGGAADALEQHRAWWAGLVAGVAHVRRAPVPGDAVADEVPLATLVDRLGPPSRAPETPVAARTLSHAWLLALLATALLLQWLSRRLRGAP